MKWYIWCAAISSFNDASYYLISLRIVDINLVAMGDKQTSAACVESQVIPFDVAGQNLLARDTIRGLGGLDGQGHNQE